MDSIVLPELPTYLFEPSLAGVISLAVTAVLPLVAALFMKRSWNAAQKGVILLVCAAIKAFLEAWLGALQNDLPFDYAATAYAVVINFGIAVATYFGLLRGTKVQQEALDSLVVDPVGNVSERR
jgi:hypothetical protein